MKRGSQPDLNAAFGALSDPTRRAILARLAQGEATVMELARPFAMTQPAVSRHLRVLESAGLIARTPDGTRRRCRLSRGGVDAMDAWLDLLRKAMEQNYNRLDDLLIALDPTETNPSAAGTARVSPKEPTPIPGKETEGNGGHDHEQADTDD